MLKPPLKLYESVFRILLELLQNINAPLRKLCNSMFFANKKIMVAIMRSTKTNAMEAIMKKFMGIATAAVLVLGFSQHLLKQKQS